MLNKMIWKIFPSLISAVLFCCAGCRTVPAGNPPPEVITIRQSDENDEVMTLAEAINLAATELAVSVFAQKGDIRILFKNNPDGNAVTVKLYRELKMFLPVKSVLKDENYIVESSFNKRPDGSPMWYLRLKDKNGKIIYNKSFAVKDEVLR